LNTSTGIAVGVFVFQNQRSNRHSNIRFSKPALETPQQRPFFNRKVENTAAVSVFQEQGSKQIRSAGF